MAEVKWIKISVDMFDNRKIKHIRQLPNGDTIVLVWIMLLTIAGRCNDGGMIYLTPDMPYSTKMLAEELRVKESVVKSALEAFERLDMVERNGDLIIITGWSEHQNVTGLDKVREQTKKRVAKHREARKNVTELNCNVTERYIEYGSNGNVTLGNATDIEEDIEKELELNKKKSVKENTLTIFERLLPDYDFHESLVNKLKEWFAYKMERKEPYKEAGMKALLSRVNHNCYLFGKEAIMDLIDDSMANGWKGIIFDRLKEKQPRSTYHNDIKNRVDIVDTW